MSAKQWGKRLAIGLIIYFFSLIIVFLLLGRFVGSTTLVPTLIILIILFSPVPVFELLIKKYWKCPACQNKLPVYGHRLRRRYLPRMPRWNTPYCPKCGADIDIDTAPSSFPPEAILTRAMAVTILHRLAGEPMVPSYPANTFSDVPPDQWFSEAIAWGTHHEIILETDGGYFSPHADVTRELFAAMLYRYSVAKDLSVEVPADFHPTISPVPMRWAVYHRLLPEADTQDTLNPGRSVTRAQSVTILQKFVKVIESGGRAE